MHLLPVCKFSVPVNVNTVKSNSTVLPADSVVNELQFDLSSKHYLFKNDLAMLAIIAANNWKRPICFTTDRTLADIGLEKYARQEGMTYRLTPVLNSRVNNEQAYKNIMEKFRYGKLSASKTVVSILKMEVLPAPSGPINPNNSPSFTSKDTSSTASTLSLLYVLLIC